MKRDRTKLTEAQIEEAARLYNDGATYDELCAEFNCKRTKLHRALEGRVERRRHYRIRSVPKVVRGSDFLMAEIPDHVRERWLSRAREYASRTDTTAILMNDPLSDVCALYNAERR
jgi:hypothetical protein